MNPNKRKRNKGKRGNGQGISGKKAGPSSVDSSRTADSTYPPRTKKGCTTTNLNKDAVASTSSDKLAKSPVEPKFDFEATKFDKIKGTDHFVDKTRLIEVLLKDSSGVLITAPRAFGKSVNMDMIKQFLEIKVWKTGSEVGKVIDRTPENDKQYPEENLLLFHDEELYIYRCHCKSEKHTNDFSHCQSRQFFNQHHGKYPVIHVNFQSINSDSYEKILQDFRSAIARAFENHKYLLKCDSIWDTPTGTDEFEKFKKYLDPQPASEVQMEADTKYGLPFLAQVLYTHFKREVYFLVDEYDAPINNVLFKPVDMVEKVNDLLTVVFKNVAKDSTCPLRGALFTGISYFASVGLSGFRTEKYMWLMGNEGDERYAEFYGLTTEEIDTLLKRFITNFWNGKAILDASKVKKFYNGYTTLGARKIPIYPIWSVLHALRLEKLIRAWEKSGLMMATESVIQVPIVRYAIEKLVQDNALKSKVQSKVHLKHLHELRKLVLQCQSQSMKTLKYPDVYLSFLLQQGYLIISSTVDEASGLFEVKLPNEFIKEELKELLVNYYEVGADSFAQSAVEAFNEMECDLNDDLVKRLICALQDAFEVMDEKWELVNEDCFHSALFNILSKTKFMICTEAQGYGARLDLAFRSGEFAVIIEVKYKQTSENALNQIYVKRYLNTLKDRLSKKGINITNCNFMGLNVSEEGKVTISYSKGRQAAARHVTS